MIKKIISLVVLLVFAILAFIFLKGHTSELKNIFQINLSYLAIIIFTRLFHLYFRGLKLKVIMEFYSIHLKFKEWLGLTIVTTLGNYLTPFRAGISAMAVYFKKMHNFAYTSSISITGALWLIQVLIFGILGFAAVPFFPFSKEFKYIAMVSCIIASFVSLYLLFFIPLPFKTNIKVFKRLLNIKVFKHLLNSLDEFRKFRNFSFIIKMIFLNILRILILSLGFYLEFKAFNFNAPFSVCILISIFSALSWVISLTPEGLGVKESLIVITSTLTGAGILVGTFVAALDRAISIVITFTLGPSFGYILFKRIGYKANLFNTIKYTKKNV